MFCQLTFAETASIDSLKNANKEFDKRIYKMVKTYEQAGVDFVLLRVYDTLWAFENRCYFVIKEDTCSKRFGLSMDEDYSIHDVSISNVADFYSKKMPCRDEISEIETALEYENYFKDQYLDSLSFENSPYTLYGKINGKYLHEEFNREFISKFHSGMLYDTICNYLGARCEG